MNRQLEKCPFCGEAQDYQNAELHFCGGGPPPGYAYVCQWCGAHGPMGVGRERGDHVGAKVAAIDEWNNRN